jgi:hypothetical protein
MTEDDREPQVVLAEMAPVLAVLATRGLYAEQPGLWSMGERGRERTLEDFGHHFRALQSLNGAAFRSHVHYCRDLFRARDFPHRWLDDAWRWMETVIRSELPEPLAARALAVLNEGIAEDGNPQLSSPLPDQPTSRER